jgi:transglutaminase-like putative cysteine protease
MKWEILHRTRYEYAAPARDSFNEVRLQPFSDEWQSVDHFLLKVLPAARLQHHHDFYSNVVHHFEIAEPHATLLVESQLRVTTRPRPGRADTETPFPLARIGEAVGAARCFDFLQESRFVELSPEVWRRALDVIDGVPDTWQAALRLMQFVYRELKYQSNSTSVHTHAREVWRDKRGVCQDFAHVLLGLCRAVKIPALYVSGYLATETARATHAWVEVMIPGWGWQPLDPTHNCQPGESYIKIAVGRDYADVAPVTGNYRGSRERRMDVTVDIRPIH